MNEEYAWRLFGICVEYANGEAYSSRYYYTIIAIGLAIPGILNPVIGALVHNAVSVLVIINLAFLLTWRKKK